MDNSKKNESFLIIAEKEDLSRIIEGLLLVCRNLGNETLETALLRIEKIDLENKLNDTRKTLERTLGESMERFKKLKKVSAELKALKANPANGSTPEEE